MGWHMEGTPSWTWMDIEEGQPQRPMPWKFDSVPCGLCGNRITPSDAYVFWAGIETTSLGLGEAGGEEHHGEIFLHPECGYRLAHTLIKDSMMAEHLGIMPGAGLVGGANDYKS